MFNSVGIYRDSFPELLSDYFDINCFTLDGVYIRLDCGYSGYSFRKVNINVYCLSYNRIHTFLHGGGVSEGLSCLDIDGDVRAFKAIKSELNLTYGINRGFLPAIDLIDHRF